ncbi:MAG: SAM-dependent methyltransferase [Bacteroides sp.]|nr:SAM-dependent methyltransferase [Bacteroides sp.]
MSTEPIKDEIVLNDDELICALTEQKKKATPKEVVLQSVIQQMNDEYGFEMGDMERNFTFQYEDEEGRKKRSSVDLAIFRQGAGHDKINLERVCVICDSKVSADDKKKGVEASLHSILVYSECDFGLWTNGDDLHFCQRLEDEIGNVNLHDISDFPGANETIEDLERQGERAKPRKPANDSLVKTFKRCHDYIYGNEGKKKTAFWELLNMIFCKIYDEKRRYLDAERNISYRRKFWVGVKEQNTTDGQKAVASRIKGLFEELKTDELFNEVFDGNEQIGLSDRGLAYVASELSKYSFLDATVDVKGTAYETIVSNTLKQEAGQFFTPRNIIKCMVEMMNPTVNTRVLDPACGSGGFLVMVLDHVRHQIAQNIYPDASEAILEAKSNSDIVVDKVRRYAEKMIFGFDFDPDLRKAARMNMVMAGDGHANIFNINSLEYPNGSLPDVPRIGEAVKKSIAQNQDKDIDNSFSLDSAFGKFDMIFTNPPFGSKVAVAPAIAEQYSIGNGSSAPEILFIEQCYNFLKPGGRMGIVLPDGILSNPNTEAVREWILKHFIILASVDLPVETFLPQVGVQASLLFLQKKTKIEMLRSIKDEDYQVFMAIAESVGKDRRGAQVFERDEEGAEILFNETQERAIFLPSGDLVSRTRKVRVKHLDDDLPKIAAAYKSYIEKK